MVSVFDKTAHTLDNETPMDVKLAVLADFASITREGKLNILGIFDEFTAPSFPAAIPMFYVVVSYEAGPAEFNTEKVTQVALFDADGKVLVKTEQKVTVAPVDRPGGQRNINVISGLARFPFPGPGDYQFAVLVDGNTKTTIRLRVNQGGKN